MITSEITEKIYAGGRLTREEAVALFRDDDIFALGRLGSTVKERMSGNDAYFVVNRHVNPTNICINRCKFCAFSRSRGEEGAYELSIEEILGKLKTGSDGSPAFSEVHIVGGLHPDWPFDYYCDLLSAIKETWPALAIKAFTAVEIDYMARIAGLGIEETLLRLRQCGLDLMPGGGAEVFSGRVRGILCPEKISGERWLEIMECAHRTGIRTNATMLYGHIETIEERVDHLIALRDLQDRTGGFQAFIPLAYHPKNTEIGGTYSSGIDDLRTIAVSRLVLDNFDHIKAYWIMLGEKVSQIALLFGADDLDGTVVEERITHAAGGMTPERIGRDELVHLIRKAGRRPVERDAFYHHLWAG
ncbi:MAG TPA: aminofutalosine synthase MqnE [Dissulfurispiraceae bacterium]|nr:aminofutalosine synthase MqnE [Dissulfurispiraceae bacterium]